MKKNIYLVLWLCLILSGCGEDVPPSKSNSFYTPPTFKKNESAVVSPDPPARPQSPVTKTAQPAAAATQAAPPQTAQPATAAAPATDTKSAIQRPATQIINDAAAVVDYGTGATPLNIKKKQADKIQAIQNQNNQKMKKALNEK
jgi:hypothetical protein